MTVSVLDPIQIVVSISVDLGTSVQFYYKRHQKQLKFIKVVATEIYLQNYVLEMKQKTDGFFRKKIIETAQTYFHDRLDYKELVYHN